MIRHLTCVALLTAAVPAAAQTGREASAPSISEKVAPRVESCDVTLQGDVMVVSARVKVQFPWTPGGDVDNDGRMQSIAFQKIEFSFGSTADDRIAPTVTAHPIAGKGSRLKGWDGTGCGGASDRDRVVPSPRPKPGPMLETPAGRSAGRGTPISRLQSCSVSGSPEEAVFEVKMIVHRDIAARSEILSILPGGSGDPSAVSCDGKGGATTGYDVALNKKA